MEKLCPLLIGITLLFSGCKVSLDNKEALRTVEDFYNEWISYAGNPVQAKLYTKHPAVTEKAKSRLDIVVKNREIDPVLCQKEKPETITVELVADLKEAKTVRVHIPSGTGSIAVDVGMVAGRDGLWLIDDISCPAE